MPLTALRPGRTQGQHEVDSSDDADNGQLRGSTFGSGSAEVSGSTNHDIVRSLFGELSNKKVKFVD